MHAKQVFFFSGAISITRRGCLILSLRKNLFTSLSDIQETDVEAVVVEWKSSFSSSSFCASSSSSFDGKKEPKKEATHMTVVWPTVQ